MINTSTWSLGRFRAGIEGSSSRRRGIGWIGALVLLGCVAPANAQRMPRGSYLRRPVRDTAQMIGQLKGDARVVERYSRVFHLTPEIVRATFEKLRLTRTTKELTLRVYYVQPGERIGYRVRRVRKGTPVFVLPDGSPVLMQACGNPLRPLTPEIAKRVKKSRVPEYNPEESLSASLSQWKALDLPVDSEGAPTRELTALTNAAPRIAEPEGDLTVMTTPEVSLPESEWDFVEDTGALAPGFTPSPIPAAATAAFLTSDLTTVLTAAGGLFGISRIAQNIGGSTSAKPGGGDSGSGSSGGGDTGGGTGGGTVGVVPEWDAGTLFLCVGAGGLFANALLRRFGRSQRKSV